MKGVKAGGRILAVTLRPGRRGLFLLAVLTVLWLHAALLQRWQAADSLPASAVVVRPVPALAVEPVAPPVSVAKVPPRETPSAAVPTTSRTPPSATKRQTSPPVATVVPSGLPAAAEETPQTLEAASPEPPPVYATEPPPRARLHYALSRADGSTGEAVLDWQPDSGSHYEARLQAELAGAPLLLWTSRGSFDAAGIAPERFTERRRSRSAKAVNFQRDAGVVSFSGPTQQHALVPGSQDRLSVLLQLSAIARAAPNPLRAGDVLRLVVAGVGGDADVWRFDVLGEESLGAVHALHLHRSPTRPYELRLDLWLDLARHGLPLRARFSHRDDGSDALEFHLLEATSAVDASRYESRP
jgi:hypothetical protein